MKDTIYKEAATFFFYLAIVGIIFMVGAGVGNYRGRFEERKNLAPQLESLEKLQEIADCQRRVINRYKRILNSVGGGYCASDATYRRLSK